MLGEPSAPTHSPSLLLQQEEQDLIPALEHKCLLLSCALVFLCLSFGFPTPAGRTRRVSVSSDIAFLGQGVKADFQHLWGFRRPPALRPDVLILAQIPLAPFSLHYRPRCCGERPWSVHLNIWNHMSTSGTTRRSQCLCS